MKGLIVKGIGGFYFVKTEQCVFRAKARGLLKRNKEILYVGDEVEAIPPKEGEDDGWISEVYTRRNVFHRPPIVNIDVLIVVMAVASPEPNPDVTDRLLVMAESKGISPVVCINKADLDRDGTVTRIKSIYDKIYPTVVTSCKDSADEGIRLLKEHIGDKKAAFAGPSGVGKSSLTNLLIPEASMEVGEVSEKTERGRHTTRHVEIFSIGEGFLFDTPGFTSFELDDVDEGDLAGYFPEIKEAATGCRFGDCSHTKEPDCNVLRALEENKIAKSRYESYIHCLEEIRSKNKF